MKSEIGIDLGTRNALSAVVRDGKAELIPNRWGSTVTHSVVAWDNGSWLVGEDALKLALTGSKDVWWDLKRRVGSSFSAVLDGKSYGAQDLLVPLITALREDAEAYLGEFVSSCVLAVPACFSLVQRELIMRSANEAGLHDVRIIAEPTAAALSFGRGGRFLVLDFGAGTVDISVVESEVSGEDGEKRSGVWQVLESVGTDELGGYEFDVSLARWLSERLLLEDVNEYDPRWRMLLQEAERIKIALSTSQVLRWRPPAISSKVQELTVYREDLERLMRFSIRRLIHTLRRMWLQHRPEHLLLVGGSSRIPLLKRILEQEVALPERLSLCAEDAVVRGAALCTGGQRLLLDALSGDIFAEWGDERRIIIPADAPLPAWAEIELCAQRSKTSGAGDNNNNDKAENLRIFQSRGDMSDGSSRPPALLASVNVDTSKPDIDGRILLKCSLSASGRMTATLQRNSDEILKIPIMVAAEGSDVKKRLHDLRFSVIELEPSLTRVQQDRLRLLLQRVEGAAEPELISIIEDAVRDIRLKLFSQNRV